MDVVQTLVEYDPFPIAVDEPQPRFSWKILSRERDIRPTACHLRVASRRELLDTTPDLWDSGEVTAEQPVQVRYAGSPLKSDTEYFWTVRVRGHNGTWSSFAPAGRFSTAFLAPADWTAHWIGRSDEGDERGVDVSKFYDENYVASLADVGHEPRVPAFRREFTPTKTVCRARAFVSGLGFYELRLNGARVGDRVLAPARTDYRRRVLYDVYDVTRQIQPGANALGILVGHGWFNPQKKYWSWRMQWYGQPRFIFQLQLDYADGSRERIISDESWRSSWSPILASCIYDGEQYDARLEQPGWDLPNFSDQEWTPARQVVAPGGRLVSAPLEPERVVETFFPEAVMLIAPGIQIFDLGRNISGWVRLKVSGSRGTTVTLRFAERLHENGRLDTSTNMRALATDRYVLRGDGQEVWEPRFTWHGFRYVEVSGLPKPLALDALEGRFVYTDCAPIGHFICDNELINKIQRCTLQSLFGNLHGLPTDCPQRDERLGWLGDVHVTVETALMNIDLKRLYTKWLDDIRDTQDASGKIAMIAPRSIMEEDLPWTSAYLLVPWHLYEHTGDLQPLARHYEAFKHYMRYLETQSRNHIQKPARWGDHLCRAAGWRISSGMPECISTAFYFLDARIMSRTACLLDRKDEAVGFERLAEDICRAFNARYFNLKKSTYDDGNQTSNALALALGLVTDAQAPAVLRTLLNDIKTHGGHLTTGVIGTKYLIDALVKYEQPDTVGQLLTRTGYPSWSDLLHGDMTTLPEAWDRRDCSWNHVIMGSIAGWFYQGLAGIKPDPEQPGFARIHFKPYFADGLNRISAEVNTVRGIVRSAWQMSAGVMQWEVIVPPTSRGVVILPAVERITESGQLVWERRLIPGVQGISAAQADGKTIRLEVASGRYLFNWHTDKD